MDFEPTQTQQVIAGSAADVLGAVAGPDWQPQAGQAGSAGQPGYDLTAWQALFEHAGLKAGQSILVNGAGGAVGGYAVQLAARAGSTVTATASPSSAGRVRSYGADQVIDYTATPLPQAVAGQRFDVVLNLVRTDAEETAALADLADVITYRTEEYVKVAKRR